jgi:hypothetical protein
MEAYRERGDAGLPEDLDPDARCLLDRAGRVFSLSDLRAGSLVEGDYPALADALTATGSAVGIADLNERSRAFFVSLGIRTLTSISGTGVAAFGAQTPSPPWFKPRHRELLLDLLRRPLFSRALHELAVRQRHATFEFRPVELAELQRRVVGIAEINFLDSISREYRVGGHAVQVPVDTALQDGVIGLVGPRTKLDFQQLTAHALAEVAGAVNAAQARALSTTFFPLLLCRTTEDMHVLLERMGVDMRRWSYDHDDQINPEDDAAEDVGEKILRHVVQGLNTTRRQPQQATSGSPEGPESASPTPTPPPRALSPFTLPDLGEVTMSVVPLHGQQMQPWVAQGRRSGGSSSSGWMPRSGAEVERDRDVGRRGEELVYLMELVRLRAIGHENPEDLVIWTSQTDPGADHDIRSVGEDGRERWIEVKSSIGTDGHFEWSKNEFEKALREGDRYELWRVYRAASINPAAKCFANPVALLGTSRLVLELGSLRACIEDLG